MEQAGSARARILIIDDDPLQRQSMGGLFEPSRYEILEAPDVGAGLDVANKTLPQIIISDVLMPRLSGFDMIAAVRTSPSLKYVPIVICSAMQPPSEKKCLDLGANAYFSKPLDFEVFYKKVLELLGHSH